MIIGVNYQTLRASRRALRSPGLDLAAKSAVWLPSHLLNGTFNIYSPAAIIKDHFLGIISHDYARSVGLESRSSQGDGGGFDGFRFLDGATW